jgi:hypothetical protein
MSRLSDASSRRLLIPLEGFGEPTKDYLLAAASAGLPAVAAVKALLNQGLRRAVATDDNHPGDGGRGCCRCGGAGGAGAARGEDRAAGSGGGREGASGQGAGGQGNELIPRVPGPRTLAPNSEL